MNSSLLLNSLLSRALPDGGFMEHPGGDFRPDATGWAILALIRAGSDNSLIAQARRRLATVQKEDGRVSISANHPDAFWPTPISLLAWYGASEFEEAQSMAIRFLLATTGKHGPKQSGSPVAHNSNLKGWPWVANTHSWVEPTSLSLFALKLNGLDGHPRMVEAVKMLIDRQLPGGGWNYGNTIVYSQELQPMPDTSGLALQALASLTSRAEIDRSLNYLKTEIHQLRTPLSLAWAILGLGSWSERPMCAEDLISECLDRQEIYGDYSTTQLSLLLLALMTPAGLTEVFPKNERNLT